MKLRPASSSSDPRARGGADAATDLSPGMLIAAKYRLERLVGRGGMGSVWAARNEQLGNVVALKFIEASEGSDLEDARARFEREAKAAARIRSPHVAQIFEYVADATRPFIAMELLDGEDLGERLRRETRISLQAASKILTQSAKALRRAHEAGIIHRDLKPGNVFLARFDDDEVVKILDFGVAKVRSEGAIDGPLATQTGIVFGSPSYMSPEQARGVRALDHRTDLWSMAVIMFRAITGVKPFQANSIGDLVVKLCIDPLPIATSFAPELPPAVDRFFDRAFARDPERRFTSAVEMAAAFEAIAAGAPATGPATRPPSVAPQIARVPAPRIPVQELPPAPPLAPASSRTPGSGPHVGFASGTLTPPPGSAPSMDVAPPSARTAFYDPSHDAVRAPRVPAVHDPTPPSPQRAPLVSQFTGSQAAPNPPPSSPAQFTMGPQAAQSPGPASPTPLGPSAALATLVTPAEATPQAAPSPMYAANAPVPRAPMPSGAALAEPMPSAFPRAIADAPHVEAPAPIASPRTISRGVAIGAGIGIGALALLVVVIAIAAGRGPAPATPAASGPTAEATATAPKPAIDPAPTATEAPAATATPSASATEAATADPAPTAEPAPSASASADPSASAEPDPSATPRVRTKPTKKRPNFGY